MKVVYPAIITPPATDSFYVIEFPDLEGCWSQGHTLAEVMAMGRDALAVYLDTLDMEGMEIPGASPLDDVTAPAGSFATLIDADPEIYARQRNNRAVKKTISIPEWMDEKARQQNISLSKELQDALERRFKAAE